MAYTVRLIDCTDSLAADKQTAVASQLTTWISAADGTRPPDKRSGVNVSWTTSVSSPTAASLLIYVVTNRESSVLRHMRSFKAPDNWDQLAGLTYSDGHPYKIHNGVRIYTRAELSGSELYLAKGNDVAALATFAFHEAIHNQLHKGSEMHSDPAAGGAIAAETVKPGTTPTQENLTTLGAAMDTARSQWIDGYARAHPERATAPLHPHH
jgi:hypothetical protein